MSYTNGLDNPELYFQCKLYTGTGTSTAFTLDGDEDMQPDLVWIKARDDAESHQLYDAVRGTTKHIESDTTDAEATEAGGLTAFGSDGFTVGDYSSINNTDGLYVAWCWKESATAGFDIDSNSGTGSARTEAHSLSAVPHVIFTKSTDDTTNWAVYHHKNTSAPETDYLRLNSNRATADDAERWNDTAPTSSVFSVGTDSETNASGNSYITYLWSEKQGFSKFGSYTGNGNDDGTFVYTGFRPAWVMIKLSSGTDNWVIDDNKRSTSNVMQNTLFANATTAEYTGSAYGIDFLSNGFKVRNDDGQYNTSGST